MELHSKSVVLEEEGEVFLPVHFHAGEIDSTVGRFLQSTRSRVIVVGIMKLVQFASDLERDAAADRVDVHCPRRDDRVQLEREGHGVRNQVEVARRGNQWIGGVGCVNETPQCGSVPAVGITELDVGKLRHKGLIQCKIEFEEIIRHIDRERVAIGKRKLRARLPRNVIELQRCRRFQPYRIEQRETAAIKELEEEIPFQLPVQRGSREETRLIEHIVRKHIQPGLDHVERLVLRVVVVNAEKGNERYAGEHALVGLGLQRRKLAVVVRAER